MNDQTDIARDRHQDEFHLDGSALGGLLADIFGQDITGGDAACRTCGSHSPVGALMAFGRAPGSVLSCPGCGAVLLVVVRRPESLHVTFRGLGSLDIPGIVSTAESTMPGATG